MATPLTVLIPCKNERLHIQACIESVRGIADEILVADSGSTDDTKDIVRSLGSVRLIERDEYINSANFKNWAIPQASHDWVLIVDSDERVTPELAAEIRKILASDPDQDAYSMRRHNFFIGHEIRHCGWNQSRIVRLFRRQVCRYPERRVHAGLEVQTGKVGQLQGKLLHYTFLSMSAYVLRLDRYTTWAAQDLHESGRRVSALGIFVRPVMWFFRSYVVRGGFLDRTPGLILCFLQAFYNLVKYAKLWELHRRSRQDSVDGEAAGLPSPEAVHTASALCEDRSAA